MPGAGAPKAAASAGAPALVALAALFCATPVLSRTPALSEAAGTYDIAGSSQIRFTVDQIGGGGIKGRFTKFSGVLRIDGRRIGASTVSLTIYPQSVAATEDRIANFLRSSAVFDAAAYPTVTFRSTAVRQTGEDAAIVDGMLTARGITHREQFAVRLQQLAGRSIAFAVTGDVYRSRYRMDVGVPIYLNVVKFDMDIRAVRR
ncbi:YceI family protein [Mycoplana sp. MJR14]|uniref:YceI family protein n=1 Tax=Mycoplana sp. MJR14 TaxID=3032583 RepID=UPI0023D9EBF2|nr:YceI family protein [Mycoplana sp. MJR14]MDF1632053.1 YceI family protein [Mycoplana sp. MJR14]